MKTETMTIISNTRAVCKFMSTSNLGRFQDAMTLSIERANTLGVMCKLQVAGILSGSDFDKMYKAIENDDIINLLIKTSV